MEINGKQCILRPWRAEDAESLARHGNNRKAWRNMTDMFPHPYTLDDAQAWLDTRSEDQGTPLFFAIEVNGEAAGGTGFRQLPDVHQKSFAVGYWLAEIHWGRGVATEALGLLTDYAFQNLDVERLEADVFAWNPASARVLEKCGFTFEGRLRHRVFKDGEFVDQLVYSRLRSD